MPQARRRNTRKPARNRPGARAGGRGGGKKGFPTWVWIVGGLVLVYLFYRYSQNSNQTAAAGAQQNQPNVPRPSPYYTGPTGDVPIILSPNSAPGAHHHHGGGHHRHGGKGPGRKRARAKLHVTRMAHGGGKHGH